MEKDKVRYRINQEKMNVVLRNKMISSAAERRLYDSGAGVVVEALLQLAGDSVAPRPASHGDILKEVTKRKGGGAAAAYLDQYLKILQDDRTRLIHKVGDDGGGESCED